MVKDEMKLYILLFKEGTTLENTSQSLCSDDAMHPSPDIELSERRLCVLIADLSITQSETAGSYSSLEQL